MCSRSRLKPLQVEKSSIVDGTEAIEPAHTIWGEERQITAERFSFPKTTLGMTENEIDNKTHRHPGCLWLAAKTLEATTSSKQHIPSFLAK